MRSSGVLLAFLLCGLAGSNAQAHAPAPRPARQAAKGLPRVVRGTEPVGAHAPRQTDDWARAVYDELNARQLPIQSRPNMFDLAAAQVARAQRGAPAKATSGELLRFVAGLQDGAARFQFTTEQFRGRPIYYALRLTPGTGLRAGITQVELEAFGDQGRIYGVDGSL